MKQLQKHSFNPKVCRQELGELQTLLSGKTSLKERDDVLPFFKRRHDLSMLIATYFPLFRFPPDVLAHEYPLYGDFIADLIVGNTVEQQYLLVEFEDGTPKGLFVERAPKSALEWAPRYEHAFSQVVDWFWKLDDMRSTGHYLRVFGSREAKFHGLIVTGKDVHLEKTEQERLRWRQDRVVVDSKTISCTTFNGLSADLDFWLQTYYGK